MWENTIVSQDDNGTAVEYGEYGGLSTSRLEYRIGWNMVWLSKISKQIVKKLGREPQPYDSVTIGARTYIFGNSSLPEMEGIIPVGFQINLNDDEMALFFWKDGRLTVMDVEV